MNQTLRKFQLFLLESRIQIESPNNYLIQQHNTLADIEAHCKKGRSKIGNFHFHRTQLLEYLDCKFLHFYQTRNLKHTGKQIDNLLEHILHCTNYHNLPSV